jgi:hypothetical protein
LLVGKSSHALPLAAFITQACNAHRPLVESLKIAEKRLSEINANLARTGTVYWADELDAIRAALANAGAL